MGGALLMAAGLPVVWVLTREQGSEPSRGRSLTDTTLQWRCDAGHSFPAAGQIGPRVCWECDRPAFPVATYSCPMHGPYAAYVRFAKGNDGEPYVAQVKLQGGGWVLQESLSCPKCGKALRYTPKDPLEAGKRRRGG